MRKTNALPTRDKLVVTLPAGMTKGGQYNASHQFDLRALRDGRTEITGRSAAFSGRPRLASQICSQARIAVLAASSRQTVAVWFWAVSHLWRSLDLWEKKNPAQKINDVTKIPGPVWEHFAVTLADKSKDKFSFQVYDLCATAVEEALSVQGTAESLPTNPMPKRDRPGARRRKESPYSAETEKAIHAAFRSERHAVTTRIDRANAVADTGDDPNDILGRERSRKRREPHTVWTLPNRLNFFRHAVLPEMLNFADFQKKFSFQSGLIGVDPLAVPVKPEGYSDPDATMVKSFGNGNGLGALYRNFVPANIDLFSFVGELQFCGFNLQTCMDIDRDHWFEPLSNDRVVIFSRKIRAGGKYVDVESGTGPDTPYGIIREAIRITEPLHDFVVRELRRLEHLPVSAKTKQVLQRIDELNGLRKRVWLTIRLQPIGVSHLNYSTSNLWSMARKLLAIHNVEETAGS